MTDSNDVVQTEVWGRSPQEATFKLRTLSQVSERLKGNTEPQVQDEVTKRPWVFKAVSPLPVSQPLDYFIPLRASLRAPGGPVGNLQRREPEVVGKRHRQTTAQQEVRRVSGDVAMTLCH